MFNRIITGDSLKVIPDLDTKFDIIIADPPYNIGKDFGNDSDKMSMDKYIPWSLEWIDICRQKLTDTGILYVYGVPEILCHIAANYKPEHQKWLVWHYTNKSTPSSKFWQRSHESILCLWKEGLKKPDLQIDQIREEYSDIYKSNIGKTRKSTPGRYGSKTTTYNDNGGALPRDVITEPVLAGMAGNQERYFVCRDCDNKVFRPNDINDHRGHNTVKHPTQKPEKLTLRLINSAVPISKREDSQILIPFAGSGSECLVAHILGMKWIGIEMNPEYAKFGQEIIDLNRTLII